SNAITKIENLEPFDRSIDYKYKYERYLNSERAVLNQFGILFKSLNERRDMETLDSLSIGIVSALQQMMDDQLTMEDSKSEFHHKYDL
ncbi:MAG: hypothetical protein JKY54_12560, partial [Flavobacteriales bacterium]|nr:hypothetical protein [Flavobacteriales bacterium]